MMKAILVNPDGTRVVLLGLSHANLDRLRSMGLSGYIEIKAADMDIPHDILITAAETEQVLLEAFAGGIGPNTKVHIDKKFTT
jgi:hypothetical protein